MNFFNFLFIVLLHLMLLFIVFAEIIENNLSFKNDILIITNHLYSNKTFAKLELKIQCYADKEKQSFSNKTAVWLISCNNDSLLKISVSRKINQSEQLNFALSPKLNVDPISKQLCLMSENVASKWFLYNNDSAAYKYFQSAPLKTDESYDVFPILEPIFYHKYGFVLILDDLHPWTLQKDNTDLCFKLDQNDPKLKNENLEHEKEYYTLKWSIIMAANTRHAHEHISATGYLRRPKNNSDITDQITKLISSSTIPATAILQQRPKNSEKIKVTQPFLIDYSRALKNRGVQKVHILLDSDWADENDQLTASSAMFTNITELLEKIHAQNQYLTVTLSPVFESSSRRVNNTNLFVRFTNKQIVVDLSQLDGAHWLVEQWTNFISQYPGIDGIFCTGGDVETLEGHPIQRLIFDKGDPIYKKYPNFLTTKYGQICADSFDPKRTIFTSTAFKSQHLLQVISLSTSEKESKEFSKETSQVVDFTAGNAFEKLFARMMSTALAGYPMVMPMMAYSGTLPSNDWMLRWLQLTACFPLVHFPANLGSYLSISGEMVYQINQLRSKIFIPRFKAQAEVWQRTGEPIVRPLWYSYPDDEETFNVESQFLIGDDFMVTLVGDIDLNSTTFTTYFPKDTNWTRAFMHGYDNFKDNAKGSHNNNNKSKKKKIKKIKKKATYYGGDYYALDFPVYDPNEKMSLHTLPCFTKL